MSAHGGPPSSAPSPAPAPAPVRATERRGALYVAEQHTTRAPHLRSRLDVGGVMRCVLWAAAPCVVMALYNTGLQANRALAAGARPVDDLRLALLEAIGVGRSPEALADCLARGAVQLLPLLAVSLLAGWAVEHGFARARGRTPDHHALVVIALLYTLCLPPTMPLAKAALGSALAFLVGKEIFGGLGRNLLNPPLTGLALLYFAYPGSLTTSAAWVAVDGWSGATPLAVAAASGLEGMEAAGLSWQDAFLGTLPGAMGATSTLACGLGAFVLLASGVASWRVMLGGVLGLPIGVALLGLLGVAQPATTLPWSWHLVSGGFAFGIVFLATDPVSAAATNPGRWIYGVLIGALAVLIRVVNPAYREGVMLAILLGNVSAPLIDQLVARVQMRPRRDHGVE